MTTIYAIGYSTTGRAKNGRCDTMFMTCVKVENEEKSWKIPLLDATMNQAALLAIKFGLLASKNAMNKIQIITDNQYVAHALELVDGKWKFNPESNKELVEEVRKMLLGVKFSITSNAKDQRVASMKSEVKGLAKMRIVF